MSDLQYHLQDADMVVLRFLFKGSRKLTASRTCITSDLEHELKEAIDMLERVYANYQVRQVEVIKYSKGHFAYFDWPQALGYFTLKEEAQS